MKRLNNLKKQYDETDIPEELDLIVKSAIKRGKKSAPKRRVQQWMIGAAAAAAVFVGSVNASPQLAQAMAGVPVLGSIVEAFTVQQIKVDKGTYQADIEIPALEGLDPELQTALNDKYIDENQKLYERFEKEMGEMESDGNGGHLGVASGYEIVTDTDQLLSIVRYELNTVGSSSTVMKYDTVDKENSILLTLPILFKDDHYVEVISNYVKEEMRAKMAADENLMYFLNDEDMDGFDKIQPDQQFYITDQNKLVISFDKYEVAPGFMGTITFEIPTDVIQKELVSNKYIK